jgi:soluble lytic murein transglycosylase-like protein
MSRMGTAEKLSVAQIQQAIKNGTLPAYVGIPMLQDKLKQEQAMRSAQQQAQQPQPSIAEQVMAQAQSAAPQGIPQLESNLPAQAMAEGGIVAFARGGYGDESSDEDDEDYYDTMEAGQAMDDSAISRAIMARSDTQKPAYSSLTNAIPESIRSIPEAVSAIPAGISTLVQQVKEKFSPAPEPVAAKAPVKGQHKYHERIVQEAEKLSLSPDFALRIAQKETGNLANPESAVSPAGALGVMQLMPRTARGLGVKDPLNPDENISGGVRYAKQMLDKYGDEKLAAMAYNWGPGNVDKWLKSGKGIEALPRETQKYAAAFAEGGSVKHFQLGGLSAVDLMNSSLADVKRMAQMGEAGAADELLRRQKNMGIGPPRMAGSPPMPSTSPVAPAAAAVEAPGAARGVASLLSRSTVPLMVGSAGYGITNAIMDKKQAEELALYGKEPELTEEEIARASKPAFMRDVSMSPKEQKERKIKPLAPLTYTPAGVETYGSRPGYTPPSKVDPALLDQEDLNRGEGMRQILKESDQAAFDKKMQELQDQPMKADQAATTGAAKEKMPSSMDEYLQMLKGGYEDVKKQKEEDKYLALLAAGLGMMGGTSPYAGANIGAGALQGVASLASARKDRAAEKNALDRAYGQALYRQNLGENTAAYKQADLDVRRDTLALNQKKELDNVLNNIQTQAEKRGYAVLKTQGLIGLDTPPEEIAAKLSQWVAQDLAKNKGYRQVYKERWGSDYDVEPTGGGASYAGFKLVK